MTWAWDMLARTPAAEARLHAELDAVLGERDPVPDDVPRLRFTRDVVAEVLRLRPPAWILGRRVMRPIRLGDVGRAGRLDRDRGADRHPPQPGLLARAGGVPAGALVERRDRRAAARRYFPFGGGNRVCIGEGFAWTEAVLILATLARRFRFPRHRPRPVPLDPLVTLRRAARSRCGSKRGREFRPAPRAGPTSFGGRRLARRLYRPAAACFTETCASTSRSRSVYAALTARRRGSRTLEQSHDDRPPKLTRAPASDEYGPANRATASASCASSHRRETRKRSVRR